MKYELASGKSKHKGNTLFSCADTTGTPMIDGETDIIIIYMWLSVQKTDIYWNYYKSGMNIDGSLSHRSQCFGYKNIYN